MNFLNSIGSSVVDRLAYVGGLTTQWWKGVSAVPRVLPFMGKRGRWSASIRQMYQIGVAAVPMVAVVGACAGLILAIQSATVLNQFGAVQLVIEIVVIAFTKELGPLLTAIVVSGRSGSAFSAEIGTMVVTEEIDALSTMAIDPVEFVLAPKYLAALIVVPCLTIMNCAFGMLAGGVFMFLNAHMALSIYLQYVTQTISAHDVFNGLLKSLVFSTIIVHVGCMEGFRVSGGPESVGRSATAAVVKSTFLVILADLLITAVLYLFGAN
jgi:phospholipid/cholesterol/gamma-HCH transport system permease protein